MAQQPEGTGAATFSLEVKRALGGGDGPEILSVTISKVPLTARLSAGTDQGSGIWSLTEADLEGLTYWVPSGGSGEVVVSVSVVTRAAPDDAARPPPTNTTTTAFGIAVPAPPGEQDEPEPEPEPEPLSPPVQEPTLDAVLGEAIALDIDTGFSDTGAPKDLRILISGVPPDARLTAGADNGDETWTLSAADLVGLNIHLPPGAGDGLFLGIAVTVADSLVASGSLMVEREEASSEPEPEPIAEPAPVVDIPSEPIVLTDIDAAPPSGYRPIAYWKLDEASGTTTADQIGGHHGRVYSAGDGGSPFGAIASFDGVDDYIEVPHSAEMTLPGGTFTVWFSAFATGSGTLAAKGVSGTNGHFALRIDNAVLEFVIQSPHGPHTVGGASFGPNEWNQVTLTWGPRGHKAYMNGELFGADDYVEGLAGNQRPWIFGAAETADALQTIGDFFHGELDDIAIYATPFNAAEVRELCHIGVKGMMTGMLTADVDSALDFSAIPAEFSGPDSLGTLDSPVDADPEPSPEPFLDPLPGLDEFPEIEAGAISIAEGNDLILEGGEKVEW
ncbi:MAG: LamG domain-containing protein [Proteobacteria bacterium]|nr:LamG domain-containing protein [Pseudomonadota bacterium]